MKIRFLGVLTLAATLTACGQLDSPPAPSPAPLLTPLDALDATAPAMSHTLYNLHGSGPPVLLLHGYMGSHDDETYLASMLASLGFATYTVDIKPADAAVADNAEQVAQCVDEILAEQHADKIFLVGHSMGGLDARYYDDFLGGANKVKALVTLATPNHGTLSSVFAQGGAKADLALNSPLVTKLAAVHETVPTLSLYSYTDNIVIPYTSAHLDGATNVALCCYSHTGMRETPKVIPYIQEFLASFAED
ncbi:MAG: alpha/beta fold hydrolase [Dehalococcoidales bacterium]|nr:alpha/beta fold hydrolase [Dehalococcoidales bacterium]